MAAGTQDLKFRILASVLGAGAISDLEKRFQNLDKNANNLKRGLQAVGAYFGAREIVNYGKSLLDVGDQLDNLSQRTGVSISTLARLREQATLSDVSFDELAGGLKKLSAVIYDAGTGGEDTAAAFRAIGVSVRDSEGNLKNAGQVVGDLQKKFALLKDGPEKAALAMQFFGRGGVQLVTILNQTADASGNLSKAIDENFTSRSAAFNDTLDKIGNNLTADGINNMKTLLPTLQELAGAFEGFTASGSDFSALLEVMGETARVFANGLITSFSAAVSAIDLFATGVLQMGDILGLQFSQAANRGGEAMERLKKRFGETADFVSKTSKNSLIFGDGSSKDILARRNEDTKPKAGAAADGDEANELGEFGARQKVIKSFEDKLAKMRAETAAYGKGNAEKEKAALLSELEAKGIARGSGAYERLKVQIDEVTKARELAKENIATRDFSQNQQDEINEQKMMLELVGSSAAEIQKLTIARKLDNEARRATKDFSEAGRAAYLAENELIKEQKLALVDLEQQQKQTYSAGAKAALAEYLDNARDVAGQTKTLFQNAFSGMEDALVNFVKTGKLNFADMADQIITDLIRIQIRAIAVQAITGIAGAFGGGGGSAGAGSTGYGSGSFQAGGNIAYSANGNIMTANGPLPLRKYANGGIARSPQLSVFGEGSMPEAYVPLPDGRSIPVTMDGPQQGKGAMLFNITINTQSGEEESNGNADQRGKDLGRLVTQVVRSTIMNEQRPGGMLAK